MKHAAPSILLALSLAASVAPDGATAKSVSRGSLPDLPVANAEAWPAASVVAEMPFNRFVPLKCNSTNTSCFGRLPAVPAGERWAIQFVSCKADGAIDAKLRYFYLQVTDAKITKQLGSHYLAPTYRSHEPPFNYVVSQPMVLTVAATNILHLSVTSIGGVFNVDCALSGVRQRLG